MMRQRSQQDISSATGDEEFHVGRSPDGSRIWFPARQYARRHGPSLSLLSRFLRNLNPDTLRRVLEWTKKHRRLICYILVITPFVLRPRGAWKWIFNFSSTYFGKNNIAGGLIGKQFERWGYLKKFRRVHFRQQSVLDKLDIELQLPSPPELSSVTNPLQLDMQASSKAALKQLLILRELRAKTLRELEQRANGSAKKCRSTGDRHPGSKHTGTASCSIPNVIFLPDDFNSWQPPRPGVFKSYQSLPFDTNEMRQLIEDVELDLTSFFDKLQNNGEVSDQIFLWAICAVYFFGGIFVGSEYQDSVEPLHSLLWSQSNSVRRKQRGPSSAVVVTDQSKRIQLLAATPRHPALLCALHTLGIGTGRKSVVDQFVSYLSPQVGLHHDGWTLMQIPMDPTDSGVDPTDSEVSDSCTFKFNPIPISSVDFSEKVDKSAEIYLQQIPNTKSFERIKTREAVSVSIQSDKTRSVTELSEKVTLGSQLEKNGLEPGWTCMRCLKSPLHGRVEKCAWVCRSGYKDLVCHGPYIPGKHPITFNVLARGVYGDFRSEAIIPKVIHQTWFEDVSPDRYPQLARLQRSWRNSGWDYRLYTDETARAYIVDSFPSHFVDAFDVLIPGAYKADLFRYLVLLKEGGVYVDVDVLLETDLDSFITPSLSFFAPRDIVFEFAGEPFCLWNGLLGAAPGHPFIVRAVERLVNLILDRADVYDMERDLCRNKTDPSDVWKLWGQTLLFLSGPCALGVAMNEVLGRPSMETIETGWIGLDGLEYGGKKDHGDALILIADKQDMGLFRISDPERGTIIASTDLGGAETHPRELRHPMKAEQKRQLQRKNKEHLHYSESSRNIFVWGSSGVYADKMVTNERIILNVQHEQ